MTINPDWDKGNRALGFRLGDWKPRPGPGFVNVWHTTGVGPLRRYLSNKRKYASPYDAALDVYTTKMRAGGHLLVCGGTGRFEQLAPLDVIAWNVGQSKSRPYFGRWAHHHTPKRWKMRWGKGRLPQDLAGGRLWLKDSRGRWACNPQVNAIEVVPDIRDPYGPLSDACWESLAQITQWLPVAIEPEYQLSHWDAHPRSRTDRRGRPWDFRENRWDPWTHCERCA